MSPRAPPVEARHAPPAQRRSSRRAASPAGCRARRRRRAVGTSTRVAQRELRKADRDLGVQVGAVALEALVGLDAQDDVEVAGAAAAAARPRRGRPAAASSRPRRPPGCSTCSVSSWCSSPVPSQLSHGFRTTRPSPRQTGQVVEIIRKPCECMTCPRPPQCWQVSGDVPAAAPVPLQVRAGRAPQDLDVLADAGERLGQRQRHPRLDVRAARRPAHRRPGPRRRRCRRRCRENAEKMSPTSWKPPPKPAPRPGVAEAVVARALLGIREDLVRLGRLLEPRLRFLVARVAVGVQLHRELAVGALQLAGVDASFDAQHFVIIPAVRHCLARLAPGQI